MVALKIPISRIITSICAAFKRKATGGSVGKVSVAVFLSGSSFQSEVFIEISIFQQNRSPVVPGLTSPLFQGRVLQNCTEPYPFTQIKSDICLLIYRTIHTSFARRLFYSINLRVYGVVVLLCAIPQLVDLYLDPVWPCLFEFWHMQDKYAILDRCRDLGHIELSTQSESALVLRCVNFCIDWCHTLRLT